MNPLLSPPPPPSLSLSLSLTLPFSLSPAPTVSHSLLLQSFSHAKNNVNVQRTYRLKGSTEITRYSTYSTVCTAITHVQYITCAQTVNTQQLSWWHEYHTGSTFQSFQTFHGEGMNKWMHFLSHTYRPNYILVQANGPIKAQVLIQYTYICIQLGHVRTAMLLNTIW